MSLLAGTDAILKEREETVKAMTAGFPARAKTTAKQLRRAARVAFQMGMMAAMKDPAGAQSIAQDFDNDPSNLLKDDQS